MSVFLSLVLASATPVGEVIKFNEYRSLSDPVKVGRNVVLAASQEGVVLALNEAGKAIWKTDLRQAVGGRVGRLTITSAGKWIYFQGSDGPSTVVGRIDADGTVKWHQKGEGLPLPVLTAGRNGDLIAMMGHERLVSFDSQGHQKWERSTLKMVPIAIFDDGKSTYMASAKGGMSEGDLWVTKLDQKGSMVWSREAGHIFHAIGRPNGDGRLLVDSSGMDTAISCLDMPSAKVLWKKQLTKDSITVTAGVMSGKGDVLAATTFNGGQVKLWCLDNKGRQVWAKGLANNIEGARALYLDNNRSGYYFASSNQDSEYSQLGRFTASGREAWVENVRIAGGRDFVRRSNQVELYGLIEQEPSIGAASRAWFIDK